MLGLGMGQYIAGKKPGGATAKFLMVITRSGASSQLKHHCKSILWSAHSQLSCYLLYGSYTVRRKIADCVYLYLHLASFGISLVWILDRYAGGVTPNAFEKCLNLSYVLPIFAHNYMETSHSGSPNESF